MKVCSGSNLDGKSESGTGARARRRTMRLGAPLLLSVALAAAAVLPSLTEARDTSTVSAGYQHSCIVTANATVKCFGYNKNGELGVGDTINRGDGNGGMGDELPDVDLGTGAVATAVSAGWQHTCALLEGGNVECWGRNDWGQLGKGDFLDRGDDPATMGGNLTEVDLGTAPSGNSSAVAIAVTTGQQFTCVLVEGGSVKCFGRNDEGQCGRGNLDYSVGSNEEDMGDNLPYVDLGTGVEAVSISSGTASTCAALLGGGIKCWGGNNYGGLGVGDTYNVGDEPEDMGDNLREVDLGTGEVGSQVFYGLRHACAILVGGGVKCWGDNRSGQLGLGHVATTGDDADETGNDMPFVDLGDSATSLSLGESHTCAILRDGSVSCWGKGFTGQLGRGDFYARGKFPGEMGDGLSVVDLGTDLAATSIAAGSDHTCAALDDGSLKCWGKNALGALGLGDTSDRGDDADEMGDALPAVSLGTGVTVATDTEAVVPETPAPTAAATLAATPQPTPQATGAPITTQPVADTAAPNAPSPQPSPVPSPQPTATQTAEPTPDPTPDPTTPAPTAAAGDRGVDTADAGDSDSGVFTSSNITVAAYVAAPLLAFALLACFCARRRSRRHEDATVAGAAVGGDPWMKNEGTPRHLGGAGDVVGAGGIARSDSRRGEKRGELVAGGSTKVFPTCSSVSPKKSKSRNGFSAEQQGAGGRGLDEINLAEGLVVGEGAAATPKERRRGQSNPRQFARCESDTAFAVTTTSADYDHGVNVVQSSGSSGGGVTGRSNAPPGYDDDDVMRSVDDDAAASKFDGDGRYAAGARGGGRAAEDDDDLSENGWGSFRNASDSGARGAEGDSRGSRAPPSYRETRRLEDEQQRRRDESRSSSNRERSRGSSREPGGRQHRSRRSGGDGSRSSSMR